MTPDERLDKLAERHDALTQTVELLVAMQQENERRMGQMMDAINRLTNIAAAHEERLDPSQG
ncbi:MAG TPA: hypothetical protein VKR61_08075 [Bryobacteraceae bacterium]|nr:hypothetical protein [Bryobacteraceae bacterium]